MKKLLLLSLMLGALPLTMMAQDDDDLYFVPTKKTLEKQKLTHQLPQNTYYPGCNRSVDEYNRRIPPMAMPTDTAACDTIDFDGQLGVYPDSLMQDFELTKNMTRWDGYEPGQSYWDGYVDGRRDAMVNWHSPWFYDEYYLWCDPWMMDRYYLYHGLWGNSWLWYDPIFWRYGYYGYASWYDPWYWGYHYPGYFAPYYSGYAVATGPTGTQNHGKINYGAPRGISNGRSTAYSAGTFGGSRMGTSNRSTGTLGTRSTSSTANRTASTAGRTTNAYGNFGGSRARTGTTNTRTVSVPTTSSSSSGYSTSSSSSSGGSFGGSSSGGGSFGGSRSSGGGGGGGGGGHFGGRR